MYTDSSLTCTTLSKCHLDSAIHLNLLLVLASPWVPLAGQATYAAMKSW